ncbi:hypothetical protein P153DRAFT_298963 [Dothidotthia symphoricarpi CBS 119687]|uniref:DUF1772-domain-containing protein n=1 Tax=Dothidotthia symphoricarpi CBS 119687 TaxID=1392245 RepID=A0A6A6A390_9PLEO|nr:uncharacterized protein P153DRAFT_298963 [Dothidotthia symphoricarpi CBS 119687]KAF2125645.1 hypothetical protein P153DRAFT_298963 [Dothidotthia symphoricarpi CBS 119687]
MASLLNQQIPTGLWIAQTVGITASTYLLGATATLSFIAIPTVMLAPAPLAAKQWRSVYDRGILVGPPLSILSTLAIGYLAYNRDRSSTPFKLNVTAAAFLASFVPFTFFFIVPTNEALFAKEEQLASASLTDKNVEEGVAEAETTHALIDKWGVVNLGRAALVAVASVCTVLAALDKREVFKFGSVGLKSGANRLG